MLKYILQSNFALNDIIAINFINLGKDELLYILDMRNDIRISKWMFQNRKIGKDEHFQFVEMLHMQTDRIYLAVKDINEEILGVISLNNIDLSQRSAYIGIYSNPYLKAGIGKILMNMIKHIGFNQMGLQKLFAQCLKGNNRALRFYKNQNFKEKTVIPKYIQKKQKFIDVVELVLDRE